MPAWWIWAAAAALYALFWLWYFLPRRPLTGAEVEAVIADLSRNGMNPEQIAGLESFLREDSGRPFVMVNLLDVRRRVADPPAGAAPGISGGKLLALYTQPFLRMILSRAGHPVLIGRAAGIALEHWGIDDASRWSSAGLIRYRSRRDLAAIARHPVFVERHPYKLAALEKTIAFPADPWFVAGGVPLTIALVLALAAALVQIAIS